MRGTIEQEMRNEARLLRALRTSRDAVKNLMEGPGMDIDRIIQSVQEFPALPDVRPSEAIAKAITNAFDEGADQIHRLRHRFSLPYL